jgi:hypothetical protein
MKKRHEVFLILPAVTKGESMDGVSSVVLAQTCNLLHIHIRARVKALLHCCNL